jgi:sec-independent protein translocase protein TatA
MFGLGAPELVLILVVIVVVFGATKLPQLGDGLGRAIKNFKRAVNTGNEIEVAPKKPELSDAPSKAEPPKAESK